MPIDFTLSPETEAIRQKVRTFIQETVLPAVKTFDDEEKVTTRDEYLRTIFALRQKAKDQMLLTADVKVAHS